jgi:hypothetical protein
VCEKKSNDSMRILYNEIAFGAVNSFLVLLFVALNIIILLRFAAKITE